MEVFILGAKSVIAVMLVVAGGAKFADLAGFSSTVRMFTPTALQPRSGDIVAIAIAVGEIVLGAASLSLPAIGWLNLVVLALASAFVVVSVAGFAFHRGRACRCFGALSQRKFDLGGIARSVVIVAIAVLATSGVRSSAIHVNVMDRLLLFGSAALLALVSFTVASALAVSREFQNGVAAK